jgi:hypothetical protein
MPTTLKPARRPDSAASVDAFMAALDHPRKAEIEALRVIILKADRRIGQGVKWNAPSFLLDDHFATFKLRPADTVQVVLHTGAKVKAAPVAFKIEDPAGLLAWAAPDRALVTFTDTADVRAKKAALTTIIQQWIGQLPS